MAGFELTEQDLKQLSDIGISKSAFEQQLARFEKGFPYLSIVRSADEENGIQVLTEERKGELLRTWERTLNDPAISVVKFVPASGAASRMFKELYQYLDGADPSAQVQEVLDHLSDFAFYDALNRACMLHEGGRTVPKLIERGEGRTVIRHLLNDSGLDYGHLPKALILFHKYSTAPRTAAEEHLAEGAKYADTCRGRVQVHYTLSPEHIKPFETMLSRRRGEIEETFTTVFDVTYSTQKASTDTVAVDMSNQPLRDEEGKLVFRPGGHGALIENLNDINADVIFIKNIDNVVPDFKRTDTIIYKKVLGGYVVELRDRVYKYMVELQDPRRVSEGLICEVQDFLRQAFSIETETLERNSMDDIIGEMEHAQRKDKVVRELRGLLNRPIRVCGMVRNEGEPGGGPYIVRDDKGITSLQILESTQIDMDDPQARAAFENGRYFNPVDLVCCTKDFRGNNFDLRLFVDPETGFISHKSSGGKELKALERPGLWNGAMSRWNTAFVEVPASTFNPVKTVNDLLRPAHRSN